jgi:Phosphoinositide phospholipase C, Ca2+-dependent
VHAVSSGWRVTVSTSHRVRGAAVVAACAAVFLASSLSTPARAGSANPYPLDRVLRLQDVQMLGTHNSFHRRPARSIQPNEPADYEHPSLDVQLGRQGIRSLELDAYNAPSFPVFHSIIVDDQSNCPTLVACLRTVDTWSRANPGHLTLVLFVEPKALPTNANASIQAVIDSTVAEQNLANWDTVAFDRLDTTVRSAFGRSLVTPDEVRGKRATLRDAIVRDGWPTLGKMRGRVIVVLNVTGPLRDLYLTGAPSLQGKAMFVPSEPREPSAAIIKRDHPQPKHFPDFVRQNFLVKTRADADAVEARAADLIRATEAITSGATIIATDYPVPDPTIGDYRVELPGTAVARCNPVSAPPRCRDTALENARGLRNP